MEQTFEKKAIGNPDPKKILNVKDLIDKASISATQIKWSLETLLRGSESLPGVGLSDPIPIEQFFEFIKSSNPKHWIMQRYTDVNKISFPGLSIEKIIQSGLIEIDHELLEDCLKDREELLSVISKFKNEEFSIKLSTVFDSADNCFGVDWESEKGLELESQIRNNLSIFTQSQNENNIIEWLDKYLEFVNEGMRLGVLPSDERCFSVDFFLGPIFKVDKTGEKPIAQTTQQVFRNFRLKKFAADGTFRKAVSYDINTLLS